MACVRIKDGVEFKVSVVGIRLLAAFDHTANAIGHDITITSGNDGTHSGPDDPHHYGNAYDARTFDLPDKHAALKALQDFLGDKFFIWIENEGSVDPNKAEHFHAQLRHGMTYP